MNYPTPADRFFTALIAILLLCAASFYAGRVTAPVRTRTRYLPAPPPVGRPGGSADGAKGTP